MMNPRTIALLAILAAPGPASTVEAQDILADTTARPEIRASASAERSVRPDRASMTLSFSATGRTPASAGANLAVRADSIRRALVALGISRDSLITRGRFDYWRDRIEIRTAQRYTGPEQRTLIQDTTYLMHDAIEVVIRDLSLVGRVIDAALAQRVTDISNVRYQASDTQAAEQEALQEATRKARERALLIARASGGDLGRTLLLSTQPDYRFGLDDIVVTGMSTQTASAQTEVIQPTLRVRATVYGRWLYIEPR
jgi:uncharacterized protein YggE